MNFVWRHLPPFIRKSSPAQDHRAVIGSLAQAVHLAAEDLVQLLANTSLHSAQGTYLEVIGNLFGVERKPGEPDDAYRRRITFEVQALRQTKLGLQAVVAFFQKDLPIHDINIFEPHTQLHTLSNTARTNRSRTPDYRYWSWAVIDIQTPIQLSPETKQKVAAYRACGIKTWYTILIQDLNTTHSTRRVPRRLAVANINSLRITSIPYVTSSNGRLSLHGIYHNRISHCYTSITIGCLPRVHLGEYQRLGYGKDPYGTSPYGSPRIRFSTCEIVS